MVSFLKLFTYPKYRIIEQQNDVGHRAFFAQIKTDVLSTWLNIYSRGPGDLARGRNHLNFGRCDNQEQAEALIELYKKQCKEQQELWDHLSKESKKFELKTIKVTQID